MINHNQDLPTGWKWVKLAELATIIAGQSPPGDTYRATPIGLPFFQGKADFGARYPIARVWCTSPTKLALPGDILISVRAPVGPTNVAAVECCIGRGLAAIRPNRDVDMDFVLLALKTHEPDLAKLGSGSTFAAITRNQLENFALPLPPLSEQRRIALILARQLAAVEHAQTAAAAQLSILLDLPTALLHRAFNGGL